MDPLREFRIPIQGLRDGRSNMVFILTNEFFDLFESNPIKNGVFKASVGLFKKPNLIEFNFTLDGSFYENCDTCLTQISIPAAGNFNLIGKFEEVDFKEEDLVALKQDQPFLDISQYLYEYCCLSRPIANRIDCENLDPQPCNQEMLRHLSAERGSENSEDDPWKALKGLKLRNKKNG